jgi:DNA invertase Pin-like site-specific DNA recombinase
MTNKRRTAIYCRLSKDDECTGDSASITTQKAMLTQYAKENGLMVVEAYIDDGFSGLSFERPAFLRMIEDIESGLIDVVLTKDLSRLGRDHLKVGFYTEIFFPTKRVRYIAINDGVDTASANNDIAALKNVINEFYSRDNSRKVKSSIRARSKEGMYRCSYAPFGYRKDPADKNHLVVDAETAPTIHRIFALAAGGRGSHWIAKHFAGTKVYCPSWYLHTRGERNYGAKFDDGTNRYRWTHTVIRNIIANRVYLGTTVMCKSEVLFKVGLQVKNSPDRQVVVEDTHEPLVSQEVFDTANAKIAERKRASVDGTPSIFSGLLKCSTCGKAMNVRYYNSSRSRKVFACGTYCSQGAHTCTEHRVFYDDLYSAVLADIRECAAMALSDEDAVLAAVMRRSLPTEKGKGSSSRLVALRKRAGELERLFDKLYEDHIAGRIADGNFNRLLDKYQTEQGLLENEIAALAATGDKAVEVEQGARSWVSLIRGFADLPELSAEVLNELIARIVVYDREVVGSASVQTIEIHYRFVGVVSDTAYPTMVLQRGGASHAKRLQKP